MEFLPPLMLLALVAFASTAHQPHQLPSVFKTCKQTEADYKGCLKNVIQDAMKHLKGGIKNLSMPAMDPMHFQEIKIEGTPEQPVTLTLEFHEVDVTGMGNAIIDNIEMEPGSYHMKAKAHSGSRISMDGKYKANGKILVLPVEGEGDCHIISPGLEAIMEMIGKPVERGGETYWDVTDFKLDIKNFNKLTMDFTGLFKNDKALSDNTLKFLNENSGEIANEIKPALEQALSATFKEMAKRVFDKVPYNSCFPPS